MDTETIIASIGQLSNQQRRQLLRRLRVSGLLDNEELMTDQNRLAIAPALGAQRPREERHSEDHYKEDQHSAGTQPALLESPPIPPTSTFDRERHFVPPNAMEPSEESPAAGVVELTPHYKTDSAHEEGRDISDEYQSPISGRIVVGGLDDGASVDENPHLMPPLPGQAPEQPISIVFDGGSKGNPGRGYGSYAVDWPGLPQQIVKLQFGNRVSNNEAEYDTLIAALEAIIQRLLEQGADASTASVEMRGDSQLVVYQVLGQWKCNEGRMKLRRDRVRELLENFATWRINHHDRSNSVRILGH